MRSISRRIRKLEERLGPPVETEYTRRLRERIEAGRRRLAQWREQDGISVSDQDRENREDLSGLTLTEILHRGRARVAKFKQEAPAERPETTSDPIQAVPLVEKIRVREKSTGRTGVLPANKFDPEKYERL
jgi:hypothetical protein